MTIPKSVIYTRKGCHLCELARAMLRENGLQPQEIGIDQHEDPRRKYDLCVPVVEIDWRERFRGRVDEFLLRRLLRILS